MKKLFVAATAAVVGLGVLAQDAAAVAKGGVQSASGADAAEKPAEGEELEEADEKSWEVGVDLDFMSAYIDKNSIQNDRAVFQPCVWGDWTFYDPVYLGFSVWQNWDLTRRRRGEGLSGPMNETDFNVHLGATLWESEDGSYALNLEMAHEWYTYHVMGFGEDDVGDIVKNKKFWPTTYEWSWKLDFETPYVNPYGCARWDYMRNHGWHFDLGLEKEKSIAELTGSESDLLDQFSLFADWNLNFATKRYMSFLYGKRVSPYSYYDEDEGETVNDYDTDASGLSGGIGGTTLKCGLNWSPCDHFTLGFVVGFTHILNDQVRANHRVGKAVGEFGSYFAKNDLFWGGIQAKLTF